MTRSLALSAAAGLTAGAIYVAHAVASLRAVFGGGWPGTIGKAAGIAFLYVLTALPAFFVILIWASLV